MIVHIKTLKVRYCKISKIFYNFFCNIIKDTLRIMVIIIINTLHNIFLFQLYDKLREEQPSNFKKLIPLSGDVSKENLGLSAIDRQTLTERVTIVIHVAANVKFNDSLKSAIFINTRSTRDICILAQSMKNLIVSIN